MRVDKLALALISSPESMPEAHGFSRLRSAVLNDVASENCRRSYVPALDELSTICSEQQQPVSRTLILSHSRRGRCRDSRLLLGKDLNAESITRSRSSQSW